MSDSFKVKVKDSEHELYFCNPSHKEIIEMDLEHRRMFAYAVRNNLMSRAEAEKQYAKTGAWGQKDEDESNRLIVEIGLLETLVKERGQDEKKLEEAITKLSNLRSKILKKINTKTELFQNTAEGFAEEQKMHKFIQLCCVNKEDDERFFETEDQYGKFVSENAEVMSEIFKEAYFSQYGRPDDITAEWEEVKYLSEKTKEKSKELKEAVKAEEAKKASKPKRAKKKKKVVESNG